MKTSRKLLALTAAALLPAAAARAGEGAPPCHGPGAHGAAATAATAATAAKAEAPGTFRLTLPDEALVDQEGRPVRLASDVLQDKVVVLDFVFTTCTTVCPVLTAILSGAQDRLEGLGEDVALVTVTVDPARDTPARLKAFAAKHRARPEWAFLTGDREAVKRVLVAAGAYTPSFQDHPPMVLVGDARTGEWTRFNGFPSIDRIAARVKELRAARSATASAQRPEAP